MKKNLYILAITLSYNTFTAPEKATLEHYYEKHYTRQTINRNLNRAEINVVQEQRRIARNTKEDTGITYLHLASTAVASMLCGGALMACWNNTFNKQD